MPSGTYLFGSPLAFLTREGPGRHWGAGETTENDGRASVARPDGRPGTELNLIGRLFYFRRTLPSVAALDSE